MRKKASKKESGKKTLKEVQKSVQEKGMTMDDMLRVALTTPKKVKAKGPRGN